MATELLSNALEHGLAEKRQGRVSLDRPEAGLARLTIRDDGAGLPVEFNPERTRSLGLTAARQFTSQLGARLTIREDGGVVSCFEVPLED
jgi:two-component sensor histidine kinase